MRDTIARREEWLLAGLFILLLIENWRERKLVCVCVRVCVLCVVCCVLLCLLCVRVFRRDYPP